MRNADFDYEPDPMGRLGYGVWTPRTRRDPFGRLPEDDDEPLAELRSRWSTGGRLENDSSIFELGGSVGEHRANDRLDVAKVQIALHNEGRFDLERSGGPVLTRSDGRREEVVIGYVTSHQLGQDMLLIDQEDARHTLWKGSLLFDVDSDGAWATFAMYAGLARELSGCLAKEATQALW